MSMFFPMPQFCTVLQNQPVTERSGQASNNWVELGTVNCLMYQVNGSRFSRDLVEYQNTAELYFAGDTLVAPQEGYRITNITDAAGNVLDTGYYEVIFVRRVVGLNGYIHHYSAKVKGVAE